MQHHYGDKMPLRILDEIEFWKRQESEHTVVIQTIAPNLEPPFVQALQQWGESFSQTDALASRYIESIVRTEGTLPEPFRQHISQLVDYSLLQSEQFVQFLHLLKTQSRAVQHPVVITVIDHIRRESEYFIGVSQTLQHS